MLRGGTEESPNVKLCSRPCLSAFVFANSVDALQCDLCRKDYDLKANPDIVAAKQVRSAEAWRYDSKELLIFHLKLRYSAFGY